MNKPFRAFLTLILLVSCTNTSASLIGDTVSVDRRFEDTILSSQTVTVGSGYDIAGWQNLYIDFSDYEIKMLATTNIGYAPADFNGFDFYDLDFAAENEVISSVTAYSISYNNNNQIFNYIDPQRILFSDHTFSLNFGGHGLGGDPLYISLETRISEVPLPASFLLLLSGITFLSLFNRRLTRAQNS